MKIYLPPQVEKAVETLTHFGFEAFLAGGCVRDTLMGKVPVDWDIATSALPNEIKQSFSGFKCIDTGIKHGTITVHVDHMPIEITTYRVDGAYTDSRHPDHVRFTATIEEDLARRDFTMNALAYNPSCGLLDCYEGRKDIQLRRIRCVGNPDVRFQEDSLRILRALRFSSVLDFEIEPATAESIRRNRARLQCISAERINAEFTKLLCGAKAAEIIRTYPLEIQQFLPEIEPLLSLTTDSGQNVWEHTRKTVTAVEAVPLLRLAMLLHEIKEPFSDCSDSFAPDGKGAQFAEQALKKLRYDGSTVRTISELVKQHNLPLIPEEKQVLRYLNQFGEDFFCLLLKMREADLRAQVPVNQKEWNCLEKTKDILNDIIKTNHCYSLKDLQINGKELIQWGIPEGAAVGKRLSFLLDAVIDGKCPNVKAELMQYMSNHKGANGNGNGND
jgi:tRNA nucleotidyltransferase (CCA-adding enzyme)